MMRRLLFSSRIIRACIWGVEVEQGLRDSEDTLKTMSNP
jgi:hypothetical protein